MPITALRFGRNYVLVLMFCSLAILLLINTTGEFSQKMKVLKSTVNSDFPTSKLLKIRSLKSNFYGMVDLKNSVNRAVSTNSEESVMLPCSGVLLIQPPEGYVGNQLFQYATLYATAKRYGMIPYYPVGRLYKTRLYKTFCNLSIRELECNASSSQTKFINLGVSSGCCYYNSRLDTRLDRTKNYYLGGYSISWKHFDFMREEILNELTMCPEFESEANEFYDKTAESLNLTLNSMEKVVIHIRSSDFIEKKKHGYYASSIEFILQAIAYVEKRIHPQKTPVYFVCADRVWWAKRELQNLTVSNIVFVTTGDAWQKDLAIMKSSDVIILTAGASTFGWWAAYLNRNARFVIFNYPFVLKESPLDRQTSMADMMMPNWVPLSKNSPMKKK